MNLSDEGRIGFQALVALIALVLIALLALVAWIDEPTTRQVNSKHLTSLEYSYRNEQRRVLTLNYFAA